jgi:serine/threonine protein kinase
MLLQVEQRKRWRAGDPVRVEVFFQEYPRLKADEEAAIDLVYHEIRLREEKGEKGLVEEYLARFPEFAARLPALFELHSALKAGSPLDPNSTVAAKKRSPEDSFGEELDRPLKERDDPGVRARPATHLGEVAASAYADVPRELANHPQYEIVRELGRGGMGVVYLAYNRLMARHEVLKVVKKEVLELAGGRARFIREIQAAARLSHQNVVKAHSALQIGDLLVFAMEYIDGEDLQRVVEARGALPVLNACYYAQQAAMALQHAFEKNMVHRDIKPENLILSREGKKHVVKVLDFGLSKVIREKREDGGLTGRGEMLGTPAYVAPEQMRDAAHADIRADIYSLGCTLYFLLTGSPPFKGSIYELLEAHQSKEARLVHLVRTDVDVPEELSAVVKKMMAKAPGERYQSPLDVAQALMAFVRPGKKESAGVPSPAVRKACGEGLPGEEGSGKGAGRKKEQMEREVSSVDTALPGGLRTLLQKKVSSALEAPTRKKRILGVGVGTCVLLIGLTGLWASGVLKTITAGPESLRSPEPRPGQENRAPVVQAGGVKPEARSKQRELEELLTPGSVWKGRYTLGNIEGEWDLYVQERAGTRFEGIHWSRWRDNKGKLHNFMKPVHGWIEGEGLRYGSSDPRVRFDDRATLKDGELENTFSTPDDPGVGRGRLKKVLPRPKGDGAVRNPQAGAGLGLEDLMKPGSVWKGRYTSGNTQGEWDLHVQERSGTRFEGVHWSRSRDNRGKIQNFMKTVHGWIEGPGLRYTSSDPSVRFDARGTLKDGDLEATFQTPDAPGGSKARLKLQLDGP